MQSPEINKIANSLSLISDTNYLYNPNDTQYVVNAVQKRKSSSKALDKNKISPNNKSIVKPSILNQPNNLRAIKQQKKAIRDSRRREINQGSDNEMDLAPESNVKELNTTNNNAIDTNDLESNNTNQENLNNNNNNNNTMNNNNLNNNNNNDNTTDNNIPSDNTNESTNTQGKPNEQTNQNSNKVIKRKTINNEI